MPSFECAIVGQDLLNRSHPEFGAAQPTRVESERSVRATVAIRIVGGRDSSLPVV